MIEMAGTVTKIAILSVILLIIVALIAGISIRNMADDARAELGTVFVYIDGKQANITADIDISPEVRPDDAELELDIGNNGIDVDYDGEKISARLGEEDFRELMERYTLNVTGDVKTRLFGPFNIRVNVEQEFNISFIHELSDTLNVTNVKVNFTNIFNPIIEFNLTADVTRDFQLNITDTPARLTSAGGTFIANVIELNYRTGMGGNARVSIPPLGVLNLALYNRGVLVEAWGIQVEVDIPFFNG
jgi:hypothetical protein